MILFEHICFAKQSSTKPNTILTFPYDAIFFQSLIFIEQFNWMLSIRLFASLALECKHYIQPFMSEVLNFPHSPHMYTMSSESCLLPQSDTTRSVPVPLYKGKILHQVFVGPVIKSINWTWWWRRAEINGNLISQQITHSSHSSKCTEHYCGALLGTTGML